MIARRLLATPPAMVVGFYIVVIGIPMLLEPSLPESIRQPIGALLDWAFWICAVVWGFALFTVAHGANRTRSGAIGKTAFGATAVLLVASVLFQAWQGPLEQWIHNPINPLVVLSFGAVFSAAISLGCAASALDRFEGGSGLPFKDSPIWWTVFAILLLPIGIWFLRDRVQKLLT